MTAWDAGRRSHSADEGARQVLPALGLPHTLRTRSWALLSDLLESHSATEPHTVDGVVNADIYSTRVSYVLC